MIELILSPPRAPLAQPLSLSAPEPLFDPFLRLGVKDKPDRFRRGAPDRSPPRSLDFAPEWHEHDDRENDDK
jgi:hypothetical protein